MTEKTIHANLSEALVAFQASMESLVEDKQGNRNTYSSVGEMMRHMRKAASAHELAFTAPPDFNTEAGWHLRVTLLHKSGEQVSGMYPLCVDDMTNNQKFGSAISYGRRYAMMSVLGLAAGIADDEFDTDDDGAVNGTLTDPPKTQDIPHTKNQPPQNAPTVGDAWSQWGNAAIATLRSLKTEKEVIDWDKAESDNIDNCKIAAPDVYQVVASEFVTIQEQTKGK